MDLPKDSSEKDSVVFKLENLASKNLEDILREYDDVLENVVQTNLLAKKAEMEKPV